MKIKKSLILILTLMLILAITVGCDKEESKNDYLNENYNFTFQLPSSWEDKYKVIEEDGIITFVYSEYQCENVGHQEFFSIGIISKEEYEEALNNPHMTGELLAEKDGDVYILNMPLDNIILDDEKVEEYIQLQLSVEEIKEKFSLNE